MSRDTTTRSPNTDSTFPHLSWQGVRTPLRQFAAVFLLMLMTPSIVSLNLIWRLALLLAVRESGINAESVASTVKSEAEKFSTLALFRFSRSLNQLSDVVLKMASEVDQPRFTFQSSTKKSKTSSSSRTTKEPKTTV